MATVPLACHMAKPVGETRIVLRRMCDQGQLGTTWTTVGVPKCTKCNPSASPQVHPPQRVSSEHFLVRYPWPSLRRRYGPVLPTVASSLTGIHARRSDAIRAPGLAWAATSMIAAGYQTISSCQWLS